MRNVLAVASVLALLAVACGDTTDPGSERVTASPSGTAAPGETEGTPAPDGDLGAAEVALTPVADIDQAIAMDQPPGDDTIYVAQQSGQIVTVDGSDVSDPVLDISAEISSGGERGLLGLAFSPDGERLYVDFTDEAGDTVVREYGFADGDVDEGSARTVLQVAQPFANHNGGHIAFGPDGFLHISLGDGGSAGDPEGNGQDTGTLLGSILRIDPQASGDDAYAIPDANPFADGGGRPEIWAYGLRNPWRFTWDSDTQDLWIADVGQNEWEEVNLEAASSGGGENYGWNRMEGTHAFEGSEPADHHGPIYEYDHSGGNCSVTGGYVYRGSAIAELQGAYVFADFCAGRLRAFVPEDGEATGHRFLGPQAANLASFGQDHDGELYVLSLSDGLFRITSQ